MIHPRLSAAQRDVSYHQRVQCLRLVCGLEMAQTGCLRILRTLGQLKARPGVRKPPAAVASTILARQTTLRGVLRLAHSSFQLRAVGGAKVKADVITSHALTMTRPTADGNCPSGGEH